MRYEVLTVRIPEVLQGPVWVYWFRVVGVGLCGEWSRHFWGTSS